MKNSKVKELILLHLILLHLKSKNGKYYVQSEDQDGNSYSILSQLPQPSIKQDRAIRFLYNYKKLDSFILFLLSIIIILACFSCPLNHSRLYRILIVLNWLFDTIQRNICTHYIIALNALTSQIQCLFAATTSWRIRGACPFYSVLFIANIKGPIYHRTIYVQRS